MHPLGWLGKAIVPIAIVIAFTYFRIALPFKAPTLSQSKIDELDDRFGSFKWLPPLFMIAIGLLFAIGTHAILVAISNHLATTDSAPAIRLLPQTAIWWFFPGFGALALSWEITLQLWALFSDRRTVNLYCEWSDVTSAVWGRDTGFNSRKALRFLAIILVLPIGVFTALALPMHALVTPEKITDCGYAFKTCQTYLLMDARRITAIEGFRTKDGKLTPRAGLVVDFNDGRRWSSADWGNFKSGIDPALAQTLTRATGLPIGTAATEKDIPQ
jgi:hypothetical protein